MGRSAEAIYYYLNTPSIGDNAMVVFWNEHKQANFKYFYKFTPRQWQISTEFRENSELLMDDIHPARSAPAGAPRVSQRTADKK